MSRAFDARLGERAVFDALLDARAQFGGDKVILEDQDRTPLTYTDLVRAAFVLGRRIGKFTAPKERVGVLLPSSVGGVVTFFGLHAFDRVPVMLNFSAGLSNVRSACKTSGVKTVLTSRRFVDQAKLEDMIKGLSADVSVVWLDDIRASINLKDKLFGLLAGLMPNLFKTKVAFEDPGVILFTSGSFGTPRGVVITNKNLVSNAVQADVLFGLDRSWVLFNPLPTFHCFGLTAGVILPVITGVRSFQYPSPLHTKQIPDLIRESKASVLLATDTFAGQYARAAAPEDFQSLQFLVCGAEKVREETHTLYREKFGGIPVLEGYGATEASPVLAVNPREENRHGTVGKMLPGIETRIEPVDGIPVGGRLHIRGPNIMSGYLTEAGLEPPVDGWHDTGDIVDISEDGYITILGRAKRFAKIGGEMVSLTAVEKVVEEVWPERRHAVVAISDDRKGERLVLITDHAEAEVAPIAAWARANGAPELVVPKKILRVSEVPVLGSGKTDYVTLQLWAEKGIAA